MLDGWAFCVRGFNEFPFPNLFMIWEIVLPLVLVYLLRKKINPTFSISFFYIPEFNYLILKGIDLFYTTKINVRYASWFGYNFVYEKQLNLKYWFFLFHFLAIYVVQYFLFRKYEQPNLAKNFALGVISYAGTILFYNTFYYVLRFFP